MRKPALRHRFSFWDGSQRLPIDPDEVWSAVLNKEYARIALHPDDVRYEAREPARVTALNPFGIVYSRHKGALGSGARDDCLR